MKDKSSTLSCANTRLHFILTTNFQLIIFLLFIPSFFAINKVEPTITDYFFFSVYTYFFLTLLKVILMGPITLLNLVLKKKFLTYMTLALDVLVIAFFALDCLVYNYQAMHIYDKMVIKLFTKTQGFERVEIGWVSLLSFLATFALLCGAVVLIYKFTRKLKLNTKKFFAVEVVTSLTILSIFAFTFPNYINKKSDELNIFPFLVLAKGKPTNEKMSVNYKPVDSKEIKFVKKPDVLVLFVESLRSGSFTPESAPQLHQYFSKNNCVSPDYNFSGGHTTANGTFSTLFGLHSYHFPDFRDDQVPSHAIKVFKDNGYQTYAGFSGTADFNQYYGAGYMFNVFHEFKQFLNLKNPNNSDKDMYNWAKSIPTTDDPTLKFLFFYSPHMNYYFPEEFAVNKPYLKRDFSHLDSSFDRENFKVGVYNRYLNSIRFIDDLLMKQIDAISEAKKENTIIVISGDHGQAFGEEGFFGHAYTSFVNAQIKVPFIICTPEKRELKSNFSGHINIMPTLLEHLSSESDYQKIKESFNGLSIFREENKYLPIAQSQFPYKRNKIGFATPKMKFWTKKIKNNLDSFYPYRVARLDDTPVFGDEQREEYNKVMELFKKEAYKFLSRNEL